MRHVLGTKQMLSVLDDICAGNGQPEDFEQLVSLAEDIKRGSLCGLGKSAPNPVLTTIRYLMVFIGAILTGIGVYLFLSWVRSKGPDGFHWSFLHWFGVLPMRGAVPSRGIEHDPF